MDDRTLNNLVRMAAEIDDIERAAQAGSSSSPRLRLAGTAAERPRTTKRLPLAVRLSPFAAAAACVAAAVMIGRGPSGGTPSGGGAAPVADHSSGRGATGQDSSHQSHLLARNGAGEGPGIGSARPVTMTAEQFRAFMRQFEAPRELSSGVLAIYQDAAGVVRCVSWHPQAFGTTPIEKLEPGELVKATYGQQCSIVGPHRLIAVAVSGPKENLPSSAERAQEFAQCIVGDAMIKCDADPPTLSVANASCVPHGLHVMMEMLAMGRP
jgi:hypothetical protein